MTERNIVLTDSAEDLHLPEFRVESGGELELSGSSKWSISRRTLRGGVSEGIDVIDLDNGAFRISVLPTRGMGLWRGEFHGAEHESIPVGWQSPVKRPVHPAFINLAERNGIGWLSGFHELLCRCGLAFNGPPGLDEETGTEMTLHGKIANLAAHCVEARISSEGAGKLSVTGIVDETMMFGPCLRLKSTLETEAGANWIRIRDEVTNLAGEPAELELLYHTNLGRPFLEEGATFVAPIRSVTPQTARAAEGMDDWTRYLKPTDAYTEQVYFVDLLTDDVGKTTVMLKNSGENLGLSLKFNRNQLPCFTVWKNTRLEADGYVTGLEPGLNYPNFKARERADGRVMTLQPGESHTMEIEMAVHASRESVAEIEEEIAHLQGNHLTEIRQEPPE